MESGLEHLAGTGSRVSADRVRERPFNMPQAATCKAMTPQCMGKEKYEEYTRPKPRRGFGDKPEPGHWTVMPTRYK
jgi:hypothetical protein